MAVTIPITSVLWFAWFRGKHPRTRFGLGLLAAATAFLVAPTFFDPFGTLNIYPAWTVPIHLVMGVHPLVVMACGGVPLALVTSLIYAFASRFVT